MSQPSAQRPSLYLLCGGASRRFGADKASHQLLGKPWAAQTVAGLGYAASEAVQVGGKGGLLGRKVDDSSLAEGPLAGLIASLEDHARRPGGGPLVLASCDLISPQADWVLPLQKAVTPGFMAVCYRSSRRWQPFPSLWSVGALEALLTLASEGVRSLQAVLDQMGATPVDWPWPGEGPPQANTQEELNHLLATLGGMQQ